MELCLLIVHTLKMGTIYAGPEQSLVLFLFCYERDFMLFLSDNNQADVVKAFNSTSGYLGDCLISIILILHKW